MLNALGKTERFRSGNKNAQAELILWCLYEEHGRLPVSLTEVSNAFGALHLPKAKPERLREHFRKSRNVRRDGVGYAPTRDFLESCEDIRQSNSETPEEIFDTGAIKMPPFVDPKRQQDLERMVRVYAHLFLLENSMRGLVETVLKKHLGKQWWDAAANTDMKKKHASRIANEESKKWAPTRSDFGPLYALDWLDLIKLMRKYQEQFLPYLGEVNFLHRFEDAGTFRNVVAHNGVLRQQDDFDLIRIYYQNWIDQVSGL
jgi:hypothetical protein